MLEKQCPTVIDLFLGKSGFRYITLPYENNIGGVSKRVNLDRVLQVYELVGEFAAISAVEDVLNFSCKLYNEILESCPFDGWKKGLSEI